MLSNGEVVYKSASDFVGSAVGESQKRTRDIIALSQGKVCAVLVVCLVCLCVQCGRECGH